MNKSRKPLRETLSNPRGGGRKKTRKEFIAEAIQIHGNKYDYSKVRYKNSNNQIKIICSKHGEYRQLPISHLKGGKCPGCFMDNPSGEEFFSLLNSIYKGRIDAKDCKYDPQRGKNQLVNLYCNIHKESFSIDVRSVLNGAGCPYCKSKRPTKEEFIETIKRNHGENIDVSDCDYAVQLKLKDRVKLFCNIHRKTFSVVISKALQGRGCPTCERSKGMLQSNQKKKERNSVIYFCFRDPLTCSQIKFYIYEANVEDQIKALESAILDFQVIQKYDLISTKQSLVSNTNSGDSNSCTIEKQLNSGNQTTIPKVPFTSQSYCHSILTLQVPNGNKTVSLFVEHYGSDNWWYKFYGDLLAYCQLLDWRLVKTQCSFAETFKNRVA